MYIRRSFLNFIRNLSFQSRVIKLFLIISFYLWFQLYSLLHVIHSSQLFSLLISGSFSFNQDESVVDRSLSSIFAFFLPFLPLLIWFKWLLGSSI